MFTMLGVRKHSWERLSHWLLSSQLSSISSLGAKTARDTFPEHTALWEKSGRGSLGLNTNTEDERENRIFHISRVCQGHVYSRGTFRNDTRL